MDRGGVTVNRTRKGLFAAAVEVPGVKSTLGSRYQLLCCDSGSAWKTPEAALASALRNLATELENGSARWTGRMETL